MIVGVARETRTGEQRVALIPSIVPVLTKAGHQVLVEAGAGTAASYSDAAYAEHGARIAPARAEVFAEADAVVQVLCYSTANTEGRADLAGLRRGQVLIGLMDPLASPETVREIAATGVTAFAMELMPRITRAQSMDALSAMATVSGYKAALLAAAALPRMFPMLTTAAGTITPTRVFVIGAGVMGLQAIATARRLGATVSAYDVRPAAREEVTSVGARFVELPLDTAAAQDTRGYARAQDEAFYLRQRELLAQTVAASDVVITTAAVPGKRAPVLVTADMVAAMAPGSVIVDGAADHGGNCELTRPGETAAAHGVTIIAPLQLAGSVPAHASQLYARTIAAFLVHISRDGALHLDPDDEIASETLIARDGDVVQPRVRAALGLAPLAGAAAPPAAANGGAI
jgi:proton-translocating NAD(P)+ transhydrogenase subunit alpha